MTRGEVRWYEFQPPDKRRPVLILTRSAVIPCLHDVTIAPITSTIRGIPSEVKLGVEDSMPNDCAANFHHVQTVSKKKLVHAGANTAIVCSNDFSRCCRLKTTEVVTTNCRDTSAHVY